VSYSVYKLLHVFGILLLFLALGGISVHAANGGERARNVARGLVGLFHGLGLVIILVGGFGMLARLGIMGAIPAWIWPKVVIWLLMGAAVIVPYRRPEWSKPMLFVLPLLGTLAAFFAIYKPWET
jgi:hypothetical protein